MDETCFYINDPMRRGWSLSGKRVPKRKALNRRKISLLIGRIEFNVNVRYTHNLSFGQAP
jgi:hypothetical protein